jgi:Arc/MetJ-type ribon-helix-helix transcriptional regulator
MEAVMERAHVVLPEGLLEEIDRQVGRRKRSQFLAEAAREKLQRDGLLSALDETAGVFRDEFISVWDATDDPARWVGESRRLDAERLARLRGHG